MALALPAQTGPTEPATSASAHELTSPSPRDFDFWVGEWEVFAEGKKVGQSRIERIVDGHVIFENYAQADGYHGKSLNFYDGVLRRWRQTWVDSRGNVGEFSGVFRDGAMRFEGETHFTDGRKILRRLSLFDLGKAGVRQYSERSADGGATWQIAYDFLYRPLENSGH